MVSVLLRDAVVDKLREAGIEVVTDTEEAQRILDLANGEVRLMGEDSERRKERERINSVIDEATAMVSHKDIKTVRRERQARETARRKQTKKIYDIILSGEYNDVSLQEINNYINDVTPYNPFGRRLSERLPQRVERTMFEGRRENALDALYSRVSESTVAPNERVSAEGKRKIEETKKELLTQLAKATGNWHTNLSELVGVSLQEINDYINDVTPYNPYGRRLSERLPQRVERKMYEGTRENAIDALYSRVSESAVPANERFSPSGRRKIEEKKKELLKKWAQASGNWYTNLSELVGVSLQEIIIILTMSHLITPMDGDYLNDFHKEWNERCMKERERTQSMRFTHAYAKAQSDRMNELVRQEEERLRKRRKNS